MWTHLASTVHEADEEEDHLAAKEVLFSGLPFIR